MTHAVDVRVKLVKEFLCQLHLHGILVFLLESQFCSADLVVLGCLNQYVHHRSIENNFYIWVAKYTI